MKRIALAALIACAAAPIAGGAPALAQARKPVALSAEAVAKRLASAGLPVVQIVALTAATDSNKLLGRPGQYISKADFEDSRRLASGDDEMDVTDNTIEVFATVADAQRRQAYITRVTSAAPMFTQYIYRRGTILLRIQKSMLPDEARSYEAALAKIAP